MSNKRRFALPRAATLVDTPGPPEDPQPMTLRPPMGNPDLFRLAFELAPSGMLAVAPDGRVVLANREAERVFGYGPGELVGIAVEQLVPDRLRDGHVAAREGYFRAPGARQMGAGRELHARRRDGSEFPVEIGLNPVRTDDGVSVVVSVVDISQRRAVERALRAGEERARQTQKLEALGTLAGGIAHDFNNILLGIVGYTELAQRAIDGRPEVQKDLDQVLVAAERGRQLVRRILMFARPPEAARTPLQVERVVREATGLLRASLPSTIAMDVAIDPDVPPVLAEETLVHQVVLNLATNAAHAMERGGHLRVALRRFDADAAFVAAHAGAREGRHARLTVIDDGAGMTPEVLEHLFEPFFTTKPVGKGSGLGMSVILGIVRSLHGAIDVDSAPGRGTRIDVYLPASPALADAEVAAAPGDAPARTRHALFVEDEPALAAMERRQIESLGYRVTVHTSSVDALAEFRARPDAFDVVITDNTMPHMTGLELARELSRMRPGLPVLMVSGYAEHADPEVLRAHGVMLVLRKPHTARELGEALDAILAGR
jgi:PAS domain S-box-containing protein